MLLARLDQVDAEPRNSATSLVVSSESQFLEDPERSCRNSRRALRAVPDADLRDRPTGVTRRPSAPLQEMDPPRNASPESSQRRRGNRCACSAPVLGAARKN